MPRISLAGCALAALLLLALAACDSNDEKDEAPRYDLTLAENGRTIATGRLDFDRPPRRDEDVSGRFTLDDTAAGPMIPLPITEGTFSGRFTAGDSLTLHLTEPDLADAAVELRGRYGGARYEGAWGIVTLGGYAEQGTFTAVRQ